MGKDRIEEVFPISVKIANHVDAYLLDLFSKFERVAIFNVYIFIKCKPSQYLLRRHLSRQEAYETTCSGSMIYHSDINSNHFNITYLLTRFLRRYIGTVIINRIKYFQNISARV